MPADIVPRRRTYYAPLWNADYLIVRHIRVFAERAIRAHVKRGTNILDIGCGEQPLRHVIEEAGGRYIGVDLLQNAQRSVTVLGSLTHMPFASGRFDVIVATEVIEHVETTDTAFAELARLLSPGGRAILSIPFFYPLHEEPEDFIRLTSHGVIAYGKRHGLVASELEAGGNEIEVAALTWTNLWARVADPRTVTGQKLLWWFRRGLNTITNVSARLLSRLARRGLPVKAYLGTLCVLEKPQ